MLYYCEFNQIPGPNVRVDRLKNVKDIKYAKLSGRTIVVRCYYYGYTGGERTTLLGAVVPGGQPAEKAST